MRVNSVSCSKDAKRNRLLVIDLCNPLSLGGAAIVVSLMRLLQSGIPKTEITCMVSRERDRVVYEKTYGLNQVKFLSHFWYRERKTMARTVLHSCVPLFVALIWTAASSLLRRLKISAGNPFTRSDVIIDMNSDALNEHYGIVYPLFSLLNITLASFSGRPVVVAPCSIGTFKNPFMKRFASFALNRTRVIIARELITKDNLDRLKVSRPKVVFGADLAFLYEPENKDETRKKLLQLGIDKEKRPVVGITPSKIIHYYAFHQKNDSRSRKRSQYTDLMAELTDFIVEKIGATVMLVPHSYSEKGDLSSYSDQDDRDPCREIYRKARDKENLRPVFEIYGADQIKGLIGFCDMFIACRMHSSIAATTQYVPTIVLSYGTKFEGIIGDLINQKDQLVDIGNDYEAVLNELKTKTVATWEDRESISRSLQHALPDVRKSARSILIQLRQFLENESLGQK